MNTKQTIRKVLFILLWVMIGGGMITLLAAAIGKRKKEVCRDYRVTITGEQKNYFVDATDIIKLVSAATGGSIRGQHLPDIKMKKAEELLEDNEWIKDAELWIDSKNILNITVTEREPVARVFTAAGNSFYIDSSAKKMSLSDKMSARVPVFTGFPEKRTGSNKDNLLMADVKNIALFVQQDTFWNSQVSQMDIVNCGFNCWQFEMIPVVGNHTVRLGNAENIRQKFERLFVFYKQVLTKTGFDKYPVIDVQYKGQVTGLKEKPAGNIDSVQLRKNVERLLKQSAQVQNDSAGAIGPVRQNAITADTAATGRNNNTATNRSTSPAPVKTNNPPKPRAVMKKRN